MLKQRIITALALLLFFLGALYFLPAVPWMMLTLIVILIGAWEWAGIAGYSSNERWFYVAATLVMALVLWVQGEIGRGSAFALASLFWLLPAWLWLIFQWRLKSAFALALLGWLVLLPTWLALGYLREIGPNLLLVILMVVWIADSAAYFTGRRFGKRKLAPAISPGKSWEGVWGALAAVTLFGAAVATLALASWWLIAAFWVITALSIVGDLFESWMKRVAGIKDSGTILPGHGGVLDRIDGLTSILPVAAMCMAYSCVDWGNLVK
jgi:phosphatidate cytidylyltransferase